MAQDKKIEDYLHLYLGCEYVLKIDSGQIFTKPAILNATALGAAIHKHQKPIEPILLLRPLSDISEEEKREAVELEAILAPLGEPQYSAESIRFWLSKHFDLFDLIPEGLAIDKTTIK